MKLDRVIWGVLLLFIGGVLLLDNFDIIEFYWRSVWSFFPVFIIILGVNILFNRNNSQTGNAISLGILVVALGFLFFRGQQRPENRFWWGNNNRFQFRHDDNDDSDQEDRDYKKVNFSEAFTAGDEGKKTKLNLSAGGTSFELKEPTDSLFTAEVNKTNGNFSLLKNSTDSVNVLDFKMKDNHGKWNMGNGNDVDIRLNANPIWDIQVNMGAGAVDFDLSNYKVRTFNFDGGVAELEVKLGSLLPITDVNVKTGLTHVKISIPEGAGARIKTKTGLSSRDFDGFTKISENLYETPNYKSAPNKIFINFDGGLTSFEVEKY
jgi:hypothetical protein